MKKSGKPEAATLKGKLNVSDLRKGVLVLRAINHKLRQAMVALLDEREKMTVTEIYVQLRLEQSVASQHLAILRKAGVVNTIRDGKFIHYSLNNERLAQIATMVDNIIH